MTTVAAVQHGCGAALAMPIGLVAMQCLRSARSSLPDGRIDTGEGHRCGCVIAYACVRGYGSLDAQ